MLVMVVLSCSLPLADYVVLQARSSNGRSSVVFEKLFHEQLKTQKAAQQHY